MQGQNCQIIAIQLVQLQSPCTELLQAMSKKYVNATKTHKTHCLNIRCKSMVQNTIYNEEGSITVENANAGFLFTIKETETREVKMDANLYIIF